MLINPMVKSRFITSGTLNDLDLPDRKFSDKEKLDFLRTWIFRALEDTTASAEYKEFVSHKIANILERLKFSLINIGSDTPLRDFIVEKTGSLIRVDLQFNIFMHVMDFSALFIPGEKEVVVSVSRITMDTLEKMFPESVVSSSTVMGAHYVFLNPFSDIFPHECSRLLMMMMESAQASWDEEKKKGKFPGKYITEFIRARVNAALNDCLKEESLKKLPQDSDKLLENITLYDDDFREGPDDMFFLESILNQSCQEVTQYTTLIDTSIPADRLEEFLVKTIGDSYITDTLFMKRYSSENGGSMSMGPDLNHKLNKLVLNLACKFSEMVECYSKMAKKFEDPFLLCGTITENIDDAYSRYMFEDSGTSIYQKNSDELNKLLDSLENENQLFLDKNGIGLVAGREAQSEEDIKGSNWKEKLTRIFGINREAVEKSNSKLFEYESLVNMFMDRESCNVILSAFLKFNNVVDIPTSVIRDDEMSNKLQELYSRLSRKYDVYGSTIESLLEAHKKYFVPVRNAMNDLDSMIGDLNQIDIPGISEDVAEDDSVM